MISLLSTTNVTILLAIPFAYFVLRFRKLSRTRRIPPHLEHVLILGASSGVGRALAVEYARRGARVCVVARSRDTISEVQHECNTASGEDTALAVAADFTSAEDMIALRGRLERGMMV